MGQQHTKLMAEFMTGFDLETDYFAKKAVVDVGCWTGGTTLMLKAPGAGHVRALEEAQKYARTASRLLTELYGEQDFICSGENMYTLYLKGAFNCIDSPGVVSYLTGPVLRLRRLFNALKVGSSLLVESAGINSSEPLCAFHGNRIFRPTETESKEQLNRGGWNWFLPSPSCLERWMIEAGFEQCQAYFSPASSRIFAYDVKSQNAEITRAGLSNRFID